jgi:hypothetical protein
MKKAIGFLVAFIMFSVNVFALPILKEETLAFVVELQQRPFSFQTDWDTPAIRNTINGINGKYAIFVWNKAGRAIVSVVEGDNLDQLWEDYATEATTRTGITIPAYELGKNVIRNGKVVTP